VELVRIVGLKIYVKKFDLLDESPILDIKPYLNYSDSIPGSNLGWIIDQEYKVEFSALAQQQISFLKKHGVSELENFLSDQLKFKPTNSKLKRVSEIQPGLFQIAYRTWRAHFIVQDSTINIEKIISGYSTQEIGDNLDPYQDKATHAEFIAAFSSV
jgi:hypothetical protein